MRSGNVRSSLETAEFLANQTPHIRMRGRAFRILFLGCVSHSFQASSTDKPFHLQFFPKARELSSQNFLTKGHEMNRCAQYSSSSFHNEYHPRPSTFRRFILSHVGSLFLIICHMNIRYFRGHFSFHRPFHHQA